MRRIVVVAAATALITAIISIWTTIAIIGPTQTRPDAAFASSVDLARMISEANERVDERADPVD
jgi:hypothetical protein